MEKLEEIKQKAQEELSVYIPIYNDRINKFKYKDDPKKAKYAECPTCNIRIYHKQANEVVICNTCGFHRPETTNKVITIKRRCAICGKKRKVKEYVVKGKTALICNSCMKKT